jgi:rfaE bifunctional protein nucleotidyltransferase chain/domain
VKILAFDDLSEVRNRCPGSKIVHCHGVFDVLHAGHLAYFRSAKKFGDKLVVTLTADKFVNKGPGRPFFNSKIRAEMLAALECVDFVAVNNFPTAVPVIEKLKPDFYVKGPDYKNMAADATGAIYEEERTVQYSGGRMVFTDDDTHSSSELVNKFFQQWTEDQQKSIETVKRLGGLSKIEDIINQLGKQSVVIAGEPIVDTYRFCQPENISSKSPSISARFLYEENYAGGALAIANHLSDFVADVKISFTHGGEGYFKALLEEKIDPRVDIVALELSDIPTPRKTRYISVSNTQRLFEITDLRSDQWSNHSPEAFNRALLKLNSANSTTILADFGHGLFESSVLSAMSDLRGFVGLNVQTNSSNFGFNPYTKHRRFNYLSIDSREVRVAYHDRLSPVMALTKKLRQDIHPMGASASITLGSSGATYFSNRSDDDFSAPAFTDTVIDATGAGDAYFGITTLLVKAGCPDEMIPFIGNVFAGLKTKIVGNKSPVSRAQLLKAVTAILK